MLSLMTWWLLAELSRAVLLLQYCIGWLCNQLDAQLSRNVQNNSTHGWQPVSAASWELSLRLLTKHWGASPCDLSICLKVAGIHQGMFQECRSHRYLKAQPQKSFMFYQIKPSPRRTPDLKGKGNITTCQWEVWQNTQDCLWSTQQVEC